MYLMGIIFDKSLIQPMAGDQLAVTIGCVTLLIAVALLGYIVFYSSFNARSEVRQNEIFKGEQ